MAILMLAFLSSPVGWLVGMNLATRLDPGIVSRDEGESLTENAFNIQLRSWNGCVGIKLTGILPWSTRNQSERRETIEDETSLLSKMFSLDFKSQGVILLKKKKPFWIVCTPRTETHN